MDIEKFKSAKEELLDIMIRDNHCIKSISAVRSATDIQSLIRIMNDFRTELRHQDFPSTEWVRKWFEQDKKELNSLGCFIDQKVSVEQNEDYSIFLFGDCDVTVNVSKIKYQHIVCYDNSVIRLNMSDWTLVHVLLRRNSKCIVENRGEHSTLQIIDKRE